MHTTSVAAFLVLALSAVASASPASDDALEARHHRGGFRGFGGFGGGRTGGQNANAGAAAAQAAATKAAAAKAAAAKAAAAKAGNAGGKAGNKGTGAAAPPAAAPPATTGGGKTGGKGGATAAPPPAAGAGGNAKDLQSSTTLSPSVIMTTDNGQNPPVAGQAAALVSPNNFINLCAKDPKVPLTNGLQITSGSCNPTPIGLIPSVENMPASKFQSPQNLATLPANTPFNATVKVTNIQLGTFTNAAKTYYANPQTLNAKGQIIGHTHIVIEAVESMTSTTVGDPTRFVFFKGINDAQDAQGNIHAEVAAGLPVGTYRLGTILSSQTHQPAIMPVAQHGLVDDVVYITVTKDGKAAAGAAPPVSLPSIHPLA
ncbi:hypothetical protein C8R46DRAFT_469065 [Mycena filopes]|nr:hypothetical protein C8R46DRAFT_469065 [Mycena filopes]